MLNINEQTLWCKISSFELDDPNASFRFSERLARENGWPYHFTLRVIDEYRKFIFLCCISEKGVTPSDAVDQAWHLHLTFTKSYWIDLCKNTLGKEIHHNPTKGGQEEAKKFDNFYSHTADLYKEKFDADPPADIWLDNDERFSDIDFRRVNLRKYWLIKKPGADAKRIAVALGILLIAGSFVQATGLNIFTFIIVAVFAGIIMLAAKSKNKSTNGNGSSGGCATSGCSTNSSHGGHSGCGSGCSGCSSSGCSGCGGGD